MNAFQGGGWEIALCLGSQPAQQPLIMYSLLWWSSLGL